MLDCEWQAHAWQVVPWGSSGGCFKQIQVASLQPHGVMLSCCSPAWYASCKHHCLEQHHHTFYHHCSVRQLLLKLFLLVLFLLILPLAGGQDCTGAVVPEPDLPAGARTGATQGAADPHAIAQGRCESACRATRVRLQQLLATFRGLQVRRAVDAAALVAKACQLDMTPGIQMGGLRCCSAALCQGCGATNQAWLPGCLQQKRARLC